MAGTLIASPTVPRSILRLPAHPSPRIAPVTEYARAFMLRRARERAASDAARRAKRRARAFEAVASDRLTNGGAR